MIKLIEKKVGCDQLTFQPTLVATVQINLEVYQDQKAKDGMDEIHREIGRQFVAALGWAE